MNLVIETEVKEVAVAEQVASQAQAQAVRINSASLG